MVQSKTCTKCGVCKPLSEYHKNRRSRDGLYSACKECARAAARAWREANTERARGNYRAWYAANRERVYENYRAWYAANRERVYENIHRRRARKACAVPQRWTVDSSLSDPLACWWCGRGLLGADPHVDHVLPIALGGPADQTNEVPACSDCNLGKGSKHPLVWIAELATTDLLGSN